MIGFFSIPCLSRFLDLLFLATDCMFSNNMRNTSTNFFKFSQISQKLLCRCNFYIKIQYISLCIFLSASRLKKAGHYFPMRSKLAAEGDLHCESGATYKNIARNDCTSLWQLTAFWKITLFHILFC